MDSDRRSLATSAGLVAVAFLGTLVVLLGLSLVFRGAGGTVSAEASASLTATASPSALATGTPSESAVASVAASAGPSEAASAAPTAAPSGDPVLVGAGDIATCHDDGDEATAELIDGIKGTVFTAGDNAYDDGTLDQFMSCYDPK